VVELHHAVGDHEGVVIRQADHPGAELDVAGAVRRHGDEQFRGRNDLPPRAMVLADPGLVIAQGVQPLDEFQVAIHG
jgi:hypothetical protein